MTWQQLLLATVAAGALTAATTWRLASALAGLGLVDEPNHRSMHTGSVPRGGGAGLVVSVTTVTFASMTVGLDWRFSTILVLALGLAAVGFLDDRNNLDFAPRLIAQLMVVLATVAIIRDPGLSPDPRWPFALAAFVTVVWVLGFCNAINFMDGIDGITGLNTIVFGVHVAVIGGADDLLRLPGLLIAAGAVGFLYWNAIRRVVFLGDGGAYFIGAYLALLVVLASVRSIPPLVAAAPFAIYAADTSTALARRVIRREDLTRGHREHVYQRLTLAGRSHRFVAVFTAVCAAACSATAIAFERDIVDAVVAVALVCSVVVAYLISPRWLPMGGATAS